ncbi:hypothetical protein C8F04DRAFT_1188132 [Mycena alexandri]|uniref:Uncharacterized protein n=1 Tax=Mycena alexandri TaxID=1745969 RepID=A0AAD6WZA3_9AGAR|nr:hypothetical protein C8F04DRAFT_1188132 [Mycena alexandri]
MSVVLSPFTIIRSVEPTLTPHTCATASTSPPPPASRSSSAASLTIPSEFFGPWFLTKYGVLVMDRLTSNTSSRAFEQSEDGSAIYGGVLEQADSPCFAASDFETIIAFLPLVPDLVNSFQRVGGRFKQLRALYFVVKDHNKIFTNVFQAQRYHIETGDSTLGIYVFPTCAEAEYMLNSNTL